LELAENVELFSQSSEIKAEFASLLPHIKSFHRFVKEIICRRSDQVVLCLKEGRQSSFIHLKIFFYETL
jgi:hypothetical protein